MSDRRYFAIIECSDKIALTFLQYLSDMKKKKQAQESKQILLDTNVRYQLLYLGGQTGTLLNILKRRDLPFPKHNLQSIP